MKKTDIIKCLKKYKEITDYEIIIKEKDSRELFYVLKHLEINRAVNTTKTIIQIYVSDKETTGTSTVIVTAADNSQSLSQKLMDAVTKAKTATNAYYPRAKKTKNLKEDKPKQADLNKIANNVAKAIFKADVYKNGWINSTEIFVSQFKTELITKAGINHISYSFKIQFECIPTWTNKKEEFELYKFFETGKIDYKAITDEVTDIMQRAKARANAVTIKDITLDSDIKVLVKDDMLELLVGNIVDTLSYSSIYTKQNHYSKKDVISNNKFDLTLKPVVKGCSKSAPYDGAGTVLKEKAIVKNGKAIDYHGNIRFGYYLKEKNISGVIPVYTIDAKGYNYKKEKHLIIENFSSPQLEPSSGYWGGEVRLAKYFDGKKYIPLTGFSISGNIYEDLKNVKFSKEHTIMPGYKGPKYLIFKNIQIS